MTLQSSGAISLDQIRTEYGISGAVSMNQLYKGGTYVDATKEITNAISSVSTSGFGNAGYTARANAGDLNTTSGHTGFYGGCFPYQYGFLKNAQQINPSLCQSTHDDYPTSYIWNGTARSYQPDNIFQFGGTCGTNPSYSPRTLVMECTMGRAGDYYIWGYDLDNDATLKVEIDTGSGFSTVYGATAQSSTTTLRHSATGIDVGDKIKLTMYANGEHMLFTCYISTSNSTSQDKSINVSTNVPTSGAITFSNFYGGENA